MSGTWFLRSYSRGITAHLITPTLVSPAGVLLGGCNTPGRICGNFSSKLHPLSSWETRPDSRPPVGRRFAYTYRASGRRAFLKKDISDLEDRRVGEGVLNVSAGESRSIKCRRFVDPSPLRVGPLEGLNALRRDSSNNGGYRKVARGRTREYFRSSAARNKVAGLDGIDDESEYPEVGAEGDIGLHVCRLSRTFCRTFAEFSSAPHRSSGFDAVTKYIGHGSVPPWDGTWHFPPERFGRAGKNRGISGSIRSESRRRGAAGGKNMSGPAGSRNRGHPLQETR